MTDFGAKLRELREQAGLTQGQLGEKAGLHKMSLARYEQGVREPTWAAVTALADALGVSCEAFREALRSEAPEPRIGRPPNKPRASTPAAGAAPPKTETAAHQVEAAKPARKPAARTPARKKDKPRR